MNDWQFIGRLFSNSYYVPVKGVRKTAQESNKWEKIICEFFDENPHLMFLKTEWLRGSVKLKIDLIDCYFPLPKSPNQIINPNVLYGYDIFAEIYDLELQMQWMLIDE